MIALKNWLIKVNEAGTRVKKWLKHFEFENSPKFIELLSKPIWF